MDYKLLINGIYWGYNPLILTIDPNFQRDIQDTDWLFRVFFGLKRTPKTWGFEFAKTGWKPRQVFWHTQIPNGPGLFTDTFPVV